MTGVTSYTTFRGQDGIAPLQSLLSTWVKKFRLVYGNLIILAYRAIVLAILGGYAR